MPRFKVSVSLPQLDRDRYLTDLRTAIDNAIIAAARKFLLAAVPLIPQFTGFARGALANLEDIAGRVQGGRIRSTLKGSTKGVNLQKYKYYYYPNTGSKVLRTTTSGRQFSTKPADIIDVTKAKTGSRITFFFHVDINYFDYLDQNKWHSFQAGQAAFDAEIRLQLTKLPDIGKYIIRKEVK